MSPRMQPPHQQLNDDEFIELLKQREQDAEEGARRWQKRFKLLVFCVINILTYDVPAAMF